VSTYTVEFYEPGTGWRQGATIKAASAKAAVKEFKLDRAGRMRKGTRYRAVRHATNSARRPKKASRRTVRKVQGKVSKALSRYLKKLNPAKMRGVTHVEVKKLKGGGVSFRPVKAHPVTRRRRAPRRKR
jgi:hypothetical protein